jgi:hypothetical protein
VRRWE